MSAQTMHDIAAVLSIIAAVGVVLMVLARLIPSVTSVRFLDLLYRWQLALTALVAVSSTLGSITFSEHFGWIPCRFCWYQRTMMFPIAVIMVVALIRRDRAVKWYGTALASIGLLLSGYHILIERGVIGESKECLATTPCAVPNLISFGGRDEITLQPTGFPAITLAVMAFCGFAAILALLLTPESLEDEQDGEPSEG
ncbi:MAG: disulfide bond formation protein B [Actinobacteria bacterium]|nr:disulfide bond formation protein B [Actinomycetota bacterium]